MPEAALLAIVAALAYDSVSEAIEGEESLDSTLSVLLDLSHGVPSPRNSTLSLIHRLTTIVMVILPFKPNGANPTMISIAESMIQFSMKRTSGDALDLETLLAGAFADTLTRCDTVLCEAVRAQQRAHLPSSSWHLGMP
jgi:hypothetical protein